MFYVGWSLMGFFLAASILLCVCQQNSVFPPLQSQVGGHKIRPGQYTHTDSRLAKSLWVH